MKKTLKSRTLLLVSASCYFLSIVMADDIISGGLNLIGLITLILGIIALVREVQAENKLDIK